MELMTVEEVAAYLRLNKMTVYKLVDEGKIPATRVGRQLRFNRSAIDEWLSRQSVGAKMRILVIDDDETICSLFKDTLDTGYSVTAVNDSLRGLSLAKEQDYDLVFLDLKMPGMDGAELFRQIRIAKPKLPVTVITGYPDSDLMKAALACGPFGVMSKPFRGSDILAAVNNYRFGASMK